MGPFVNNRTGVGTYHWSVANGQLTLAPINEPCLPRRGVWAGTWTRVG
jgi:hypothetical protein